MACPAINSPANWEADDLDTIDRPLRRLNFAAQSLKCGWKICCFVKAGADLGFFRGRGGWSRGAAFLE